VIRKVVGWSFTGIALSLLTLVVAIAANLWTFARLTDEVYLGDVAFVRLGDERFAATLKLADGEIRRFELRGDEWQLDTRVLKWKAWVNLLGKHTLFELDRMAGRYSDIDKARSRLPSLYDLRDRGWLDVWAWTHRHPDLAFMVDATYGSSVFLPMYDKASYRISMSTSGVLARPSDRKNP
jgi:hypothetical protein